MHNSTGYVIKQLVHAFRSALSSYGALRKFGEHEKLEYNNNNNNNTNNNNNNNNNNNFI